MRRMGKRIVCVLLAAVFLLASGAGCSRPETVVIASKPMTEQYILVEMLTLLIEDGSDLVVDQKMGIGGGTSNIHPALLSGEVDIYPEYTGTGWLFVLKEELIRDPLALYEAVRTAYREEFDVVWSGLYGFNNTFGLAVREETAARYDLETYSDLARVSGELSLGAEYDFYEREDGYPGLVDAYGFGFGRTVELDIGLKYEAIGSEEVDVINIFSTDGRLRQYNLRVLEDDRYFFPSYFAATLIRGETLRAHPELEGILAGLDGQISDEEMTELSYLVEIENADPRAVAREFLQEKGLL